MKRPPVLVVVLALVLVAVLGTAVAVLVGRARASDTANGSVPVRSLDDLTGTWDVVNTQGAPAALVAPVELTVADGRLSVRTGCNSGGGSASVEDSRLVLDDTGLPMTAMACEGPRGEQERWVLEMLQATPRLDRSGPYLYVHWGRGDAHWLGLELAPASSS